MLHRLLQAPIRFRLPVIIAVAMATCILTLSANSYLQMRSVILKSATLSSQITATTSSSAVEYWAKQYANTLENIAANAMTQDFLMKLAALDYHNGSSATSNLRQSYLDDNPFPLGERHHLTEASAGTEYDRLHGEFHSEFVGILDRSNLYDLFLILPDGTVSYSVFKEDDYATNLQDGPYASSGLGDAFRQAMAANPSQQTFVDFAPYAPSANVPASFLAQTVTDSRGTTIGVLVIQLPIETLKDQLTAFHDVGPNDEVYLVGPDNLARSPATDKNVLNILDPLPTLEHLTSNAQSGQMAFENVLGIRGNEVHAYVQNFDVFGQNWSVIVELDDNDALAPLRRKLRVTGLEVSIGFAVAALVGYLIARSITHPLANLTKSMERMADEDYESEIDLINRSDDFGKIGLVLNSFREKLLMAQAVSEQSREVQLDQEHVVTTLGHGLDQLAHGDLSMHISEKFSDDYEELRMNFNSTVETMNSLMRSIVQNAVEIHTCAEEIGTSSDNLSSRTESQAATLEQTVAALDQLTTGVKEAAESASEVEMFVSQAHKDAEDSGLVVSQAIEAVSLIRKSSTEISQIIGVIDDIAFQTNLLSLNAGVEAARAGDAGRGFAVVASEVRALAKRSSEAARQIKTLIKSSSEHVETGVGLVGQTGEALGSIIEKVSNIDTLVSGIASGSREQSIGLGEINLGMSQLDQVTQQNAAMVQDASDAAITLRNEAADLSGAVASFKLSNTDAGSPAPDTAIEFESVSLSMAPETAVDTPQLQDIATPMPDEMATENLVEFVAASKGDDASDVVLPAARLRQNTANTNGWTDF